MEINETLLRVQKITPHPQRSLKLAIHPSNLPLGDRETSLQHLLHLGLRMGLHAESRADVCSQSVLQAGEETYAGGYPAFL